MGARLSTSASGKSTRRKAVAGHWPRRLVVCALAIGLAGSGTSTLDQLDRILARGSLLMLTVNGATTYYLGPEGEYGFEYEMARAFADHLGVALEVRPVGQLGDLLPALEADAGDFIAANLSINAERKQRARFGPAYDEVRQVVVYRRGSRRPNSITDLADGRLAIVGGSTYDELLRNLSAGQGFELDWRIRTEASIEDLFDEVVNEALDFTIIDSNILDLNRRFFPELREAFEIGDRHQIAWATRLSDDDSLVQAMREFFWEYEQAEQLSALRDRHFQHVDYYEEVGTFHFRAQLRERLPRFRALFEQSALEQDLDWRLLAAVGYQESHWDPQAVSRTGVRGLMMLTEQTARQVGIDDREDPAQSIEGGARYLRMLLDRIPERIGQPDRTWLALAAYNIGYGHLEDARRLTQQRGGNPDHWLDVRESLPLLTQERWFSRTRFGYARGHEAVRFVERVRTFFEILVWMEARDHPLVAAATPHAW